MNGKKLSVLISFCLSAVGSYSTACAGTVAPLLYDQDTLAQVEALYGITEDAAVTRLAKEYDAAVQARHIEELNLSGYAGAWFDASTQALHVATNKTEDFAAIQHAGATPVQVAHSLQELQAGRATIASAVEATIGRGKMRASYIDVATNSAVVHVVEDALSQASAVAQSLHANVPVRFVGLPAGGSGFSTNLHGADRTRNGTWPFVNGARSPCSVGATTEKVAGTTYTAGFATAGHCGETGNSIVADDGTTSLATVAQSTYNFTFQTESNNEDGAWDQTVSPWVPVSQITGYSDGTINVSGTWAGMLVAPVGTTACRYGATSGGPYCGTVNSVSATYSPNGTIVLNNMIQVHGTCTEDGDSGGSLVMASGQFQGTDTGSPNTHSCSGDHSTFDVYFQPVATTLSRAKTVLGNDFAMLTSHGRSAPTTSLFLCPDMSNSGSHIYQCDYSSFDSQGVTTSSWTTNTGASSSTSEVTGSCTTGQTVNVTLAISNPYGTTYQSGSFSCPTNPIH